MYCKLLGRTQDNPRIVSCRYDMNHFPRKSHYRMKDSRLDHKSSNLNILSCKCCKFHHRQNIQLHMRKQHPDHTWLSAWILKGKYDMYHFPKSNLNRMRSILQDHINYSPWTCSHKCYICCSQGSNCQSIMCSMWDRILNSEDILKRKLDKLRSRHKIQPNIKCNH